MARKRGLVGTRTFVLPGGEEEEALLARGHDRVQVRGRAPVALCCRAMMGRMGVRADATLPGGEEEAVLQCSDCSLPGNNRTLTLIET